MRTQNPNARQCTNMNLQPKAARAAPATSRHIATDCEPARQLQTPDLPCEGACPSRIDRNP